MMVLFLWPISGIIALWLATPYWLRVSSPLGFAIMHIVACIVGPLGFLWVVFDDRNEWDEVFDREEREKRRR